MQRNLWWRAYMGAVVLGSMSVTSCGSAVVPPAASPAAATTAPTAPPTPSARPTTVAPTSVPAAAPSTGEGAAQTFVAPAPVPFENSIARAAEQLFSDARKQLGS